MKSLERLENLPTSVAESVNVVNDLVLVIEAPAAKVPIKKLA